uniref:Uncharacterized protein n=1 Tax=Meloidogyne javanica TaxID=6303 RepID=A0A915M2E8_MELJA
MFMKNGYYERDYPPKYYSRGYYGSGEREYGGDYKEGYQNKEYPSHNEYNNEGNYEQYQNGYEKEYYPEEKKPYAPEGNYRHSYDTHYCSVHGSFSLALATTYGNEYSSNYGKDEEGNVGDQLSRRSHVDMNALMAAECLENSKMIYSVAEGLDTAASYKSDHDDNTAKHQSDGEEEPHSFVVGTLKL